MKGKRTPKSKALTPTQQRLHNLIAEAGAMRLAHIASALDRSRSQVLRCAAPLIHRGLIERPQPGVYTRPGWTGKMPPPITGPKRGGWRWSKGLSAQLREQLAQGHRLTATQAARLVGCSEKQAANALQHLARRGDAQRVGHGIYVVAGSEAPPVVPKTTSQKVQKLKPTPARAVVRDLEADVLDAVEDAGRLTLAELQNEVDAPGGVLARMVRRLVQRGQLRCVGGAYATRRGDA